MLFTNHQLCWVGGISLVGLSGLSFGQQVHEVTDYSWVGGLVSTYSGDPETDLTYTVSALGQNIPGPNQPGDVPFVTPYGGSGQMIIGTESAGSGPVVSIEHRLTFSNPVSGLMFRVRGLATSPTDNMHSFNLTPDVVDASNPGSVLSWDGVTLGTSSGAGGGAYLSWEDPVSEISFTTTHQGAADSIVLRELQWDAIPEPEVGVLALMGWLGTVRRRRKG